MRFSSIIAVAAAAFSSLVTAQGSNAFTAPITGAVLKCGAPYQIKWTSLVGTSVTLTLRMGDAAHLEAGTVITTIPQNTGLYTWTPPCSLEVRDDYAFMITWGTAATDINYSDQFSITGGAASSSAESSTASSTESSSASSTATSTTTAMTTIATTVHSTVSGSSSGSSSSSGGSMTSNSGSSTPTSSSPSSSTTTHVSSPNEGVLVGTSSKLAMVCVLVAAMYLN